jgi:hypothetical protein
MKLLIKLSFFSLNHMSPRPILVFLLSKIKKKDLVFQSFDFDRLYMYMISVFKNDIVEDYLRGK